MEQEEEPLFYSADELRLIRERIRQFATLGDATLAERLKNGVDSQETKGCLNTARIALDARKHSEALFEAYVDYPPFMLYTDCDCHATILRVYGMDIHPDGTVMARTICALSLMNSTGTRQLGDLVHVKRWSDRQLERLQSGLVSQASIFTEYDGFLKAAAQIDYPQGL